MFPLAILSHQKRERVVNLLLRRENLSAKNGCVGMVDGVVAQLVERLVRNEKVAGSIPVGSTSLRSELRLGKPAFNEQRLESNLHESGARRLPRRSAA